MMPVKALACMPLVNIPVGIELKSSRPFVTEAIDAEKWIVSELGLRYI